jgi:hypothetical protein
MTVKRVVSDAAIQRATSKPFWGFSQSGSAFRSESRVDNDVTAFVRDVSTQVRDQFLSPADVEMLLRIKPEWVRSAFPSVHKWHDLNRPWNWFNASCATSAEETLKRSMPQHHDDPNAYRDWCERAERHIGCECRFNGVSSNAIRLFGSELKSPDVSHACRVHNAELPRS